jgi:hypothetical protein
MRRTADLARLLPLATALSLGAIVLMATTAPVPTVPLSQLGTLEDGTEVRVEGVLTASVSYESGWSTLTVTDLWDGSSARLLMSPSTPLPQALAPSIGDLVSATGEFSRDETGPVLFCTWCHLTTLARSRCVLDIGLLCENWQHFLGDRFEVGGDLRPGPVLSDLSGGSALPLDLGDDVPEPPPGFCVVDATLLMDPSTMSLTLRVWSMSPAST